MVSKVKAQEIIDSSGNNFHYKVVNFLRSVGWAVLVSPYYTDNYSDKPREIDLLAEKDTTIQDSFGHTLGYIKVRLFIECKYLTNEVVFWFDDKDRNRAINKVISTTPLEDPKQWSMTSQHHYLKDLRVAKLFAGTKSSENDVFYKATTQCLNALIGNFRQPSIITKSPALTCRTVLEYPVIICNSFDKLFECEKEKPKKLEDSFQLEVNYAYTDNSGAKKRDYFLIDVISFDKIPDLIKEIEGNDIEVICQKIDYESD